MQQKKRKESISKGAVAFSPAIQRKGSAGSLAEKCSSTHIAVNLTNCHSSTKALNVQFLISNVNYKILYAVKIC